jgi:hypothetical protein
MKKLYITLFALTLSIVMLVTAVAPAMATKPEDPCNNKPVAWVSWGGSNSRVKDEFGQAQLSFLIQQLKDKTTVGHMSYQDRITGVNTYYNILDSFFYETDGVKVAEIFTSTPYGVYTMFSWWILTDGGEPGATKDGFQLYASFVPVFIPIIPDWTPPGPPESGWIPLQDQDWIPGGNIQIHITEDY